jgi:5-hydroxyisourate hydrolase-like protein (transthyretin family)
VEFEKKGKNKKQRKKQIVLNENGDIETLQQKPNELAEGEEELHFYKREGKGIMKNKKN